MTNDSSIWRPLNHPVVDNSLAVCDGRTVEDGELVEADHITKVYLGRTMYGLQSPRHKWYYLGSQQPDELFFIKIFDSDPNVAAKRQCILPLPMLSLSSNILCQARYMHRSIIA